MHRDTAHAARMAEEQSIDARALLREGIVDVVVPELPDAAAEPRAFAARLARVLEEELTALAATEPGGRLRRRLARQRPVPDRPATTDRPQAPRGGHDIAQEKP
ncbi:hypothetical protein GCM10023225_35930 [Kineococcus glutinatus]|uniref:acetyl-CoA carboxytransferase n=1 Tax=Kineococcus glutinatus TaxID=1070872 RepID=A0ABP8VLG2_9ACTN